LQILDDFKFLVIIFNFDILILHLLDGGVAQLVERGTFTHPPFLAG